MIANFLSLITNLYLRFQQRRLTLLVIALTILLLVAVVMPQVGFACGQTGGSCHCPGC